MPSFLTIRTDDLAHETIDGETIVIDLRAQAYYRLEGAAATAWQALAQGCDAAGLTALLQGLYPAEAVAVAQAVPAFLAELTAHGLAIETDAVAPAGMAPPSAAAGQTFGGLVVHCFTDLEEILWVDPVHDVDEATGWPTLPPSG